MKMLGLKYCTSLKCYSTHLWRSCILHSHCDLCLVLQLCIAFIVNLLSIYYLKYRKWKFRDGYFVIILCVYISNARRCRRGIKLVSLSSLSGSANSSTAPQALWRQVLAFKWKMFSWTHERPISDGVHVTTRLYICVYFQTPRVVATWCLYVCVCDVSLWRVHSSSAGTLQLHISHERETRPHYDSNYLWEDKRRLREEQKQWYPWRYRSTGSGIAMQCSLCE